MTNPMIRIHNAETDEVIDREMNDTEFAQYTADQQAQATAQAEKVAAEQVVTDAKASRDAKLAKMGFSLAEIENW